MKDTIITYDPQEYEDWLSNNPGWSFTSTATVWNGLFSGGTITLNGISEGAAIRYALFAWGPYPTIRQNYEDWSGGSWGFAGPFSTQTGGGGAPPVSLANSLPESVLPAPGPIPEPSVTALVVLGLGVVYKFRHRDEPPFGAAGDDESETFLADRSTSLI
jgi:hypothetical protein